MLYALKKYCALFLDEYLIKICLIFATVLLAVNLIPALVEKKFLKTVPDVEGVMETTYKEEANLSNIYYFLFDEYSSLPVIKEYYGYENSEFQEYLLKNDFDINYNSRNESFETNTVTTNYMNLAYIADDSMSVYDRQNLRYKGALYALLQEQGYGIIGCGNSDFLGIDSIHKVSSSKSGVSIEGLTFSQIVLQQSILYPFVRPNSDTEMRLILETLSFFQEKDNYPIYKDGKHVVFTYLKSPHQPFYFKEDGSVNEYVNYNNWDDKEYYLGQYKFITRELTKCIMTIIKEDPSAIIIIQSDHGPRTNIPVEDKVKPFQAVRYPNHRFETIEGLSGTNVLRVVFGEILGVDLPVLEEANDKE